jgi:MoaA/NifB/PqqE/SkfB family radical SAM enzyme
MSSNLRLDLAAKLSQASVHPVVEQVRRGQRPAAPLVVELDPTSFCDLACPECISGPLLQQGRLSSERLTDLGDELAGAGVRAVILIGGGEPLLHPVVGELIPRLAGQGVEVGITTNGTQLRRYMGPIAAHVSWTRVSVDAATPATYEQLRPHRGGRSVFSQVIEGMRELATRKRGALGYSFLLVSRRNGDGEVTVSNLDEVLPAAELAREIGCDYFEVKPEYDGDHFLLAHPTEAMERLVADLRRVRELARPGFDVIAPANLDEILGSGPLVQPKSYDHCPVSELRTLITPTGAYLCPYHRGNPKARFGDPSTESFAEMWQAPARDAALEAIVPSSDCRFHCIRHSSNLEILEAQETGPGARDTVPDYDPFI